MASAPEVLRLPFLLALYTGQRQGDLLRLPWNAYDGEQIKLTQSKTGKTIKVRAAGPLKAALDAAFKVKKGLIIRVDEDGRPFSRDAFKGR